MCIGAVYTRVFVIRVCTDRFMTCHSPPRVPPATRETGSSVSPWTAGSLEGGPPVWAMPWPGCAPGQGLLFPSLLCPAYMCPPRKETGRVRLLGPCVLTGGGETRSGAGRAWYVLVATPPTSYLAGVGRPLWSRNCALEMLTPRRLLFCLLSSLGLGVSFLCDCSPSASSRHKYAEPAPSFH